MIIFKCFTLSTKSILYDPYYLLERGEKRTENMMYVSITCGPGRTIKQKRDLYQSISLRVSECSSIKSADIFITLNETAAENWSFGQGVAQLVKMKGSEKMNESIEYCIQKENERNGTCICSL